MTALFDGAKEFPEFYLVEEKLPETRPVPQPERPPGWDTTEPMLR